MPPRSVSVAALMLFVSVARSQRLGDIYYDRGRYDGFPSTHGARGYQVYEGDYPGFGGLTVGRRLRFKFDPTISRAPPLRPRLPYPRFERPRFYDAAYAPAREEVRRYRPRLFQHRPGIPRGSYVIDESPSALYYVKKPLPARYIQQPDPYRLPLGKQKNFGTIDDQRVGLYSPPYKHVSQNGSPAIYSQSYPVYGAQRARSNLFYPPNFQYGGNFGVYLASGDAEKLSENNRKDGIETEKAESVVGVEGEHFFKGRESQQQQSNDRGRYYSEKLDGKKAEEQSSYGGGKSYKHEGQNQNRNEKKATHKKGHKVHRFKTSHHKEESGDNEEYYDEEHDLGDNYQFDTNSGLFLDKGSAEFKANAEQKSLETNQAAKVGNLESASLFENIKADNGVGKSSRVENNLTAYGDRGFRDEDSLLGRQEAKRYAQERSYHVPIHKGIYGR